MRFTSHFAIRDLLWVAALALLAFGGGLDHWAHSTGIREMELESQVSSLRKTLSMKDDLANRQIRRLEGEVRALKDSSGDQMPVVASLCE